MLYYKSILGSSGLIRKCIINSKLENNSYCVVLVLYCFSVREVLRIFFESSKYSKDCIQILNSTKKIKMAIQSLIFSLVFVALASSAKLRKSGGWKNNKIFNFLTRDKLQLITSNLASNPILIWMPVLWRMVMKLYLIWYQVNNFWID